MKSDNDLISASLAEDSGGMMKTFHGAHEEEPRNLPRKWSSALWQEISQPFYTTCLRQQAITCAIRRAPPIFLICGASRHRNPHRRRRCQTNTLRPAAGQS